MNASQPLVVNRYLLPREQMLVALRQHPAALLTPVAVALVALAAALRVDWVRTLSASQKLTTWALTGCVIAGSIAVVLGWVTRYIVLTSERILVIKGFGRRSVRMLLLSQLTSITIDRSLLGRLLGYGTLIDESGRRPRLISNFIPYPEHFYLLLTGLVVPTELDDESESDSLSEDLDRLELPRSAAPAPLDPPRLDATDVTKRNAAGESWLEPAPEQIVGDHATEADADGVTQRGPAEDLSAGLPMPTRSDNTAADALERATALKWWLVAMLIGLAITIAITGTTLSGGRPLSFSAEIAIDGVSAAATAVAGSVALLQYLALRNSSRRKNSGTKSSRKGANASDSHERSTSAHAAATVTSFRRSSRKVSLVSELTELASLTERGYLNRQEFEELKTKLLKEAAR
jgi:hypothetical protein